MRLGPTLLVALLALSATAARADDGVEAARWGVFRPDGDRVIVVQVCTAQAVRATATVTLVCSIDDAGSGAGVSNTCESPGPHAACWAILPDGLLPATVCAEAVARFRDLTTATDRDCATYGQP